MPQRVAPGRGVEKVETLPLQLAKGSLLGGHKTAETLVCSATALEDRLIEGLLQLGVLQVVMRLLNRGHNPLIAGGIGNLLHRHVGQECRQPAAVRNGVYYPFPYEGSRQSLCGLDKPKFQVPGVLLVLRLGLLAVPSRGGFHLVVDEPLLRAGAGTGSTTWRNSTP